MDFLLDSTSDFGPPNLLSSVSLTKYRRTSEHQLIWSWGGLIVFNAGWVSEHLRMLLYRLSDSSSLDDCILLEKLVKTITEPISDFWSRSLLWAKVIGVAYSFALGPFSPMGMGSPPSTSLHSPLNCATFVLPPVSASLHPTFSSAGNLVYLFIDPFSRLIVHIFS